MPPLACFITFHTYGTWLHGDDRGSVDRSHRAFGTPALAPHSGREKRAADLRKQERVHLDARARGVVETTIREVCTHRTWKLWELIIRTNHAHLIVTAPVPPERVMNSLKSWASRRLVEQAVFPRGTRVWTRHGSTRYLWAPEHLDGACRYVRDGQGADLPRADGSPSTE